MGDEMRCTCGHAGAEHVKVMVPATCTRCTCKAFTSAAVAVTDLPDAVVELTDEERALPGVDRRYAKDDDGNEIAVCYWFREDTVESIVAARLAAASGPWAEQLDAAKAERDALTYERDVACASIQKDRVKAEAERDAALARNAQLQKQVEFDMKIRLDVEKVLDLALGTEPADGAGDGLASDVHLLAMRWTEALDRADALRAELDNLRGRVTALADEALNHPSGWLETVDAQTRTLMFHWINDQFRGSDCATCGHPKLRHEFVKIGDTHCSECKCPEWVAR